MSRTVDEERLLEGGILAQAQAASGPDEAPGPWLGIDFGERRIGLAISDPECRVAVSLPTLERDTDRRALAAIQALIDEREVRRLVIGEPRGHDGAATDRSQRVRRFGAKLGQRTGLPVEWVDEALTSWAAQRHLAHRKRRRKADIDARAAQLILQDALDELARS